MLRKLSQLSNGTKVIILWTGMLLTVFVFTAFRLLPELGLRTIEITGLNLSIIGTSGFLMVLAIQVYQIRTQLTLTRKIIILCSAILMAINVTIAGVSVFDTETMVTHIILAIAILQLLGAYCLAKYNSKMLADLVELEAEIE